MRRILWGRATSSNVMKAIWTLEELQLPYERLDVGGSFGKTDTAEYRAMNPTGLVPTLQEDEFTLWESNAICRYLCHAHAPHSKLWPQEPHARANIDQHHDFILAVRVTHLKRVDDGDSRQLDHFRLDLGGHQRLAAGIHFLLGRTANKDARLR